MPDLCTNIVKAFILVMQSQKMGSIGKKVNMDIVPGTNIVDTCDRDAATVWLDKMCSRTRKKRFKLFNVENIVEDGNKF